MTIVDDAKLLQLAARRPKDVFPLLDRTTSLFPLLVVLTFVPGLVSLQSASLSERDAEWRLKGLELSITPNVFDAVDPASSTSVTALKYQPPLGSWLAAAVLRWSPFDTSSFDLVEYLAAASLVPVTYLLMSRLAGRRVGFVAAALAAFHGAFLEQQRHAGPQALAVAAAMLAFWGFIGHVCQAKEIVSTDLLIGGLALGACLLAGGTLALLVIVVLLLLSVIGVEPVADPRKGGARGRSRWSTWHALRSLGVLIATAFAAGGWWELMMLYSYGSEFGTAWLFGVPESVDTALQNTAPVGSLRFARRILEGAVVANGALGGLTMLGVWIVGRRLIAPKALGTPQRQDRGAWPFLALWVTCSFAVFATGLGSRVNVSLYANMWRLFFTAASVCTAAMALDEVARRRVSVLEFVCLSAATLGCGYVLLHAEGFLPHSTLRAIFVALGVALLVGRAAQEFTRQSELREWVLIVGLIAAFVLSDAWIGVTPARETDRGFQTLLLFGRSLPSANTVQPRGTSTGGHANVDAEVCLVISETKPPARLQFVLKSAWPRAQLLRVRDWDEALKIAVGDGHTPKTAVVVDWSGGNSRPANPTGARWEAAPVGNPQFFEQRQLRAYLLVWE